MMLGQWIFFVYLVGFMVSGYVSFVWRDHSDRSQKIRRVNGNDPNAQLVWMTLFMVLSWVGFAIMVCDLLKSGYITVGRIDRKA